MTTAAEWVRTVRSARRLSQRDLAEVSGVPRTTIERIEAGRTTPRFDTMLRLVEATGYVFVVRDRHGRVVAMRPDRPAEVDRAGRLLPVHLGPVPTPPWREGLRTDSERTWWGWFSIAYPYDDRDWVPEHTYWRRRELPTFRSDRWTRGERGRVWDDAT